MATLNILPNGTTAGNPNKMGNPSPPLRSNTVGWNYQVSRRLKKWLYSIPIESLDGHGYAFTLTVRDCPPTSDDWASIRNTYIKRLMRLGCIRLQWLTEWQRRGVPHLHGIAYFEAPVNPDVIKSNWVDLADGLYGAKSYAQDSKPITSVLGWLDYLAKHAGRSANHYQRSPENIPPAWASKTGRMWGARGAWECREPMKLEIDQNAFYAYRRITKKIYHSNVRDRLLKKISLFIPENFAMSKKEWTRAMCKSELKQFKNSRKILQSSDSNAGRMMGVSDWIDQEDSIRIVNWLASQGSKVRQVFDND